MPLFSLNMVTGEGIPLLSRFCVGSIIYCYFKVLIAYMGKIGTLVYVDHFWIQLKPPNLCRWPTCGNNFTLRKFNCAVLLLLLVQRYSSLSKNRWSGWKAGMYRLNDYETDVVQAVSCH